ncbi:MAG: hypothetical protein I3270_01965 [Candidatus Moeniiplasma glomeromycotorum]|nr:hypothetical protein [Candidatus Moeniiplasma glomeromycotorum]MCE8162466.1 hypothetical protein [Candidatus Moeniiplasma glomeromycotorum]MCE8166392.1 hypothetical protein [Candidatus Moeniiplasma glomeromycotorum]MCE8166874.1 hypothetical protein [Candidatus Moeniiplasma glomeromycotorum]
MNRFIKKKKILIIGLVILIAIVGGIFLFVRLNSTPKVSNKSESEEKKFQLMVVYRFPNLRECRFYNSHTNKGFKISLDHPALKGVELKNKNFYQVVGIEKFPLTPICNQTEIGMSDKITITPINSK